MRSQCSRASLSVVVTITEAALDSAPASRLISRGRSVRSPNCSVWLRRSSSWADTPPSNMEFLVDFKVNVPTGASESEVKDREKAEASATAKLADEGHL